MNEREPTPDVDVDALMERIREQLHSSSAPEIGSEVPESLADPRPDLATLHETSDVLRPALSSHRRHLGRAVLFVKRLLLKFLTPSLELQTRHNVATTRLLTHFALRVESLEQQVEALAARVADLEDGGKP